MRGATPGSGRRVRWRGVTAHRLFVAAAAAAGVIVVGVFGPWTEVTLLSSVSVTENGIEGNLGWLLILLAALGAAAAWAAASRGQFWAAAAVLGCGVVATAVAVATRGDLDEDEFGGIVEREIGWGPTVAVIGAIGLALVGLALLWLDRTSVALDGGDGAEPPVTEAGPAAPPSGADAAELAAAGEQAALGRGAIPMPPVEERALPSGEPAPADKA